MTTWRLSRKVLMISTIVAIRGLRCGTLATVSFLSVKSERLTQLGRSLHCKVFRNVLCWARDHPGQRDETWFKREIAPKLDAFTLAEIAAATGLSLAACSRIRAGAKVPHPRHWDALGALVED